MKEFKIGYINSIETLGLVDGPGIRIVIFMQGCPLRCIFCHNPETWNINTKNFFTSKEIVDLIRKYRPYIEQGGGVTFSGGEPLFQPEFLLETLKLCKKAGIHTCIDTSGVCLREELICDILKYTDLVILDIKHINDIEYFKITKKDIKYFNIFKEYLDKSDTKLWLRQVIVPGINDNVEYILKLKEYIKNFKNVLKVELLPYHTMGIEKYKKLNIDYKLTCGDMDKNRCKELEEILNK